MSSRLNSTSFHFTNRRHWSKSTPNFMKISFHLSRFYLLSMLQHDMDFRQGQVLEFPWYFTRKWWDFHQLWGHFRSNCRQKDMRKPISNFYGTYIKIPSQPFSFLVWGFPLKMSNGFFEGRKNTREGKKNWLSGIYKFQIKLACGGLSSPNPINRSWFLFYIWTEPVLGMKIVSKLCACSMLNQIILRNSIYLPTSSFLNCD